MRVTVAICTWNRSSLLRLTLAQMTKLVVPPALSWELLVVDNNCTDDTARVLGEFLGRLPIRVVQEPVAGLSHARNRALAASSADLVLWTDDDVLVDEGWLAEFVAAADCYPDAAAFGGPIEPWFPSSPDPDLCSVFPTLASGFCGLDQQAIGEGPISEAGSIWGANMGYRRAAVAGMRFNASFGPSPTSLSGGDDVLFVKEVRGRGGMVVWCPRMRVKHYVAPERMTLSYLTKFTFGKGRELVGLGARAADSAPSRRVAPRWLWREWLAAGVRQTAARAGLPVPVSSRFRSGPAPATDCSRRVRQLLWLRERAFLAGMIQGFRE